MTILPRRIVPLSSEYSARGIEFSFLHFKQKMQYMLGFYPAITALGIRESEIQHPATPSHKNHEFCKQHSPEPRFPGHINRYNPACQLLRSNAGTPNGWVYSDTTVQTLKALTSIQTRVSTRYLNSAGPLTRARVIAPNTIFVKFEFER